MATVVASTAASGSSPASPVIEIGENRLYPHPSSISEWEDDLKKWPEIRSPQIVYYLLKTKACDLEEVKAYKSLDSYNYVQSGWVGALLVHEIDQCTLLLKGTVQGSQAVNKFNDVWICAKKDGEVITGGCTCMAGKARVCSHVGAVLWKVDCAASAGLTGQTCTDAAMNWNQGTKKNVVPAALHNISFRLQKGTARAVERKGTEVTEPKQFHSFRDDEELQEFHATAPFQSLFCIPGTLLHETLTASSQPQAHTVAKVPDRAPSHQDHASAETLPESCPVCNVFYTDFVVLTSAAAVQLETGTRGTTNALWKDSRRLRVTASNVKVVPKMVETPHEKAVLTLTGSSFHGNAATRHGQMYEPVARQAFTVKTGLTVSLCGTVVCSEEPWLSATPDGIIECRNAILEIKCPQVLDCKAMIATNKRYDVQCKDDKYTLKKSGINGFYSQIQYAMLCTQKQLCFFYLWSKNSDVLLEIPFDDSYISENTPRLRRFYFSSMLPHLENMHRGGKLDMCFEYRRLALM